MTEQAYVSAIRDLYLQLPKASSRFTRADRELAKDLHHRGIPVVTVRSALLLATARRVCRNPASPPLPPVRSLHYFVPAIDEVLLKPLPHGYCEYLESKVAEHH